MRPQSRREFIQRLAAATAGSAVLPSLYGCGGSLTDASAVPGGGSARLSTRVHSPTIVTKPGTYEITPGSLNDGALLVPTKYTGSPMPLIVGLHGAGMLASSQISLLGAQAESRGFLLLAIGSRGVTWDVMTSKYSYDVQYIDSALTWAFDRVTVDPSRLVIEGFSDGASYTLGLALANGDLFPRAIVFSAGFIPTSDSPAVGTPKFFESHGLFDPILPIDNASRRIVPMLKARGYSVEYLEFSGGHSVNSDVITAALNFALA
jgi:predicted esterase